MSSESPTDKNREGFLIGALLLISADALQRRVHEGYHAAGFTDLRPAHDPVLGLLSVDGDRIVDLAKRARTTKQAMGYLVDYLVEHGFLERIPDPTDGRSQIIRRTEKGWSVNRLARQLVQEIQDEWADQLGPDRMEQLILILRDLAKINGASYGGSVSQRSAE
jgi:DNA-binding MarR family transcriptional regulator